jgi:hypothetical protein
VATVQTLVPTASITYTPGSAPTIAVTVAVPIAVATVGAGTPTPTPVTMQVSIPVDAYNVQVTVAVQVFGASSVDTSTAGLTVLGSTFVISAQSAGSVPVVATQNSELVTLVFPYDPSLLSGAARDRAIGRTASGTVEVATLSNGTWTPQGGTVNTANNTVSIRTANVNQTWAVVAASAAATPGYASSSTGKVVWAPVPVTGGDSMNLFFDKQPSSTTFKVYNIAGQKVLDGSGASSATFATTQMAPGVYFVRSVVNYADGSSETVVQKIVVVR